MANFKTDAECVNKSITNFMNNAKKRSVICLVTNQTDWFAALPTSSSPEERSEYEKRLLLVLVSDERVFEAFNRIMVPAQKYYKNKARKVRSKMSGGS